jgi:hypothetical protein
MRIVYQSPDALVIRDSAVLLRGFGGFLVVLGVMLVAIGESGVANGHALPIVLGGVCALGGVLLALLPRTVTFAFDRSARSLFVTRQGLGRATVRETYRLRDIARVELESSRDSEGAVSYRVVTVMADGTRQPWRSYYSSGAAGMRAAVEAAGAFLARESGAAAPAPVAAPPRGASMRSSPRAQGCLLAGMTVVCLAFFGVGARLVWLEHHRLTTYEPMTATVLAEQVVESRDSDGGTTYRPEVTYRYEVDGRTYVGKRVTPLNEGRGGHWAYDLVRRFAVGGTYTGFYDPAHPSDAYLLRQRSLLPYLFVGIPLAALVLLAGVIAGQIPRSPDRRG